MAKTSAADVKNARVTIEIDGDEVTLVPSPDAIITLSRAYDGFRPLLDALARFNFDAATATIIAGLGLEGRAAKEMAEKVARNSIIDLVPPLTAYVMILLNGGKPLSDEEVTEGSDPSPL